MTTEHTERPTFAVEGSATIKHLNVRKEGPEDNKVLAVDIKLEFRRIPRKLCAYFDESLEDFLWRRDGEAMIVRNGYMEPLRFMNTLEGATVKIGDRTFLNCGIGKFSVAPEDGGLITLGLSASAYPTSGEAASLAKVLQDETRVSIEGAPDLFSAPTVTITVGEVRE